MSWRHAILFLQQIFRHILKAGLDSGLWTSGLWTLDFSSQTFTPLPEKKLYISPHKTSLPPKKNSFLQIKNSTSSDFWLKAIEQTLVVSMFLHKSALKSRTPSNDPTPILKKIEFGVRTWLHYTIISKDQIKLSIHRCDVCKLLSAASDNVVYLRCYIYSCFQSNIKYCVSLK